jgi:hypothetical protein
MPADGPVRELCSIHRSVRAYYSRKVRRFGATPIGADWTCVASQEMRFVQLLKLCDFSASFSLNDLGCGYGALLALLDRRHAVCGIDYLGIDLSPSMVAEARRCWPGRARARFVVGHSPSRCADYSVASGIFNVKLKHSQEAWEGIVRATLAGLASHSRRGFAANFMLEPAQRFLANPGLYTTAPDPWAAYCARQFNAKVEVIEGYGMPEFTLIARARPPA